MRARALFAFEGRADDELSFEKGDVIEGVAVVDADWWAGDRAGVRGVFPSSYVEPLETAPSAAPDGTPPLAAAPVAPEMTAVSLDDEDDDAPLASSQRRRCSLHDDDAWIDDDEGRATTSPGLWTQRARAPAPSSFSAKASALSAKASAALEAAAPRARRVARSREGRAAALVAVVVVLSVSLALALAPEARARGGARASPPLDPREGTIELAPGAHRVALARRDELFTVARELDNDPASRQSAGTARPAGRSYDGHEWEAAAAGAADVAFDCAAADGRVDGYAWCLVDVPATTDGATYRLRFANGTLGADAAAARLLVQATFGPTRAAIEDAVALGAGSGDASAWLAAQMARAPTLHRAHYRARANPRLPYAAAVGDYRAPCEAGSRWRRSALGRADVGRELAFEATAAGGLALLVDGVSRGEAGATFAYNASAAPGVLCSVGESVGGAITYGPQCAGETTNPAIAFASDALAALPLASFAALGAAGAEHAALLTTPPAPCELPAAGVALARDAGGAVYAHERRLATVDNALDAPSAGLAATPTRQCPSVAKTFLNKHTCAVRAECEPFEYARGATRALDAATIAAAYAASGALWYSVEGLRLDDDTAVSPTCSGWSRWLRDASGACADATVDDDGDAGVAALAAALAASADANAALRDVYVDRARARRHRG